MSCSLAAVVLLLNVLAMGPSAMVDPPPEEEFGVTTDEEAALVKGQVSDGGGPGASGRTQGPQRAPAAPIGPVARHQTLLVPACGGNSPDGVRDNLCAAAERGCPLGEVRAWAYRSPVDVEPPVWTRDGFGCIGPDVPGADGRRVVVDVSVEDFRRLPLPPATSVVEPPGGQVLINIETNAYASAGRVVVPTEVLGQSVRVRARPVGYAWDYGDGTAVGPVPDPGGPYPDLTNAHVYTAPGTYLVTLTTTYAGEFSVGGGPWLPIEGTAQVTSPAQAVTAHALSNELVAR